MILSQALYGCGDAKPPAGALQMAGLRALHQLLVHCSEYISDGPGYLGFAFND
jgi:hypothetical protein